MSANVLDMQKTIRLTKSREMHVCLVLHHRLQRRSHAGRLFKRRLRQHAGT